MQHKAPKMNQRMRKHMNERVKGKKREKWQKDKTYSLGLKFNQNITSSHHRLILRRRYNNIHHDYFVFFTDALVIIAIVVSFELYKK